MKKKEHNIMSVTKLFCLAAKTCWPYSFDCTDSKYIKAIFLSLMIMEKCTTFYPTHTHTHTHTHICTHKHTHTHTCWGAGRHTSEGRLNTGIMEFSFLINFWSFWLIFIQNISEYQVWNLNHLCTQNCIPIARLTL